MNGELRLMFLSEFWMPCSQILLQFKKYATFLNSVLDLLLFYETHVTAFRQEGTFELILSNPSHLVEETEAQHLMVGWEHQAS